MIWNYRENSSASNKTQNIVSVFVSNESEYEIIALMEFKWGFVWSSVDENYSNLMVDDKQNSISTLWISKQQNENVSFSWNTVDGNVRNSRINVSDFWSILWMVFVSNSRFDKYW